MTTGISARSAVRVPAFGIAGYWRHSTSIAGVVLATTGLRVHESIPYLSSIRPAALAAYGGGALLLIYSSKAAIDSALRDVTLRLVVAYLLWLVVTAPFALWPGLALSAVQVAPPIFALVLTLLLCSPDRTRVDASTLIFCLSAAALGALSLIFRSTIIDAGAERLSAQGSLDANDLAAVMAMALPFAISVITRRRGIWRILGILVAVLLTVVVMRSGSRGGSMAFLLGALMFTMGLKGNRRMGVFAVLLVASLAAWQFAPEGFKARIASVKTEQDYNFTAYSGRKQIWSRARGYIIEHPFAGVGVGNFPVAEGDYAAALGRPAKWSAAHNAYLQAFAELGLIGGGIFMALLFISFYRAWPLWRGTRGGAWHRPEYAAALVAFCTSAYFLSHAYFYPLFALYALIALVDRAMQRAPDHPAPLSSTTRSRRWSSDAIRPAGASANHRRKSRRACGADVPLHFQQIGP